MGDQLYSSEKGCISPTLMLHMYVLISQADENETTD